MNRFLLIAIALIAAFVSPAYAYKVSMAIDICDGGTPVGSNKFCDRGNDVLTIIPPKCRENEQWILLTPVTPDEDTKKFIENNPDKNAFAFQFPHTTSQAIAFYKKYQQATALLSCAPSGNLIDCPDNEAIIYDGVALKCGSSKDTLICPNGMAQTYSDSQLFSCTTISKIDRNKISGGSCLKQTLSKLSFDRADDDFDEQCVEVGQ